MNIVAAAAGTGTDTISIPFPLIKVFSSASHSDSSDISHSGGVVRLYTKMQIR